jgi:phenylalanyl-tRNA synthetase beta chain
VRVSLSWLSQLVDLDGVPVEELCERLTTAGVEVESVDPTGALHPEVVVGVVAAVDRSAPELTWLEVDAGGPAPLRVVSRAPNLGGIAPGTRLALARPGAVIFEWKDGQPKQKKVAAAKLKVGTSEGVGCSAKELGIGDDHSGVLLLEGPGAPALPDGLRLRQPGAPAGAPLAAALAWDAEGALADTSLLLAILPNIARCQSMVGVAREVGALLDRPLRGQIEVAEGAGRGGARTWPVLTRDNDALDDFPNDDALVPTTADPALCGRFAALRLDGVAVGPSPAWLQRRLLQAGLQPVNNVVDATNYAMIELGQPSHAYDAAALPAARLGVRRSRAGEAFKGLLAEAEAAAQPVPEGCPVIVSDDQIVALAGVMGGYGARVTAATTAVLLEVASFDNIAVRKSQQQNLMFSESSARFSRGVDPALVALAARRIVAVLAESCPALHVAGVGLLAAAPIQRRALRLDLDRLRAALGLPAADDEVASALQRAGLGVTGAGPGALAVEVPSSRQDIEHEADLWEEVARLLGYDRLPETMPVEPIPAAGTDRRLQLREELVDLAVRAGLTETWSYTLSSPELEERLRAGGGAPAPGYATLSNPGSVEKRALRRTLLAHLLECAAHNRRHTAGVHIFEQGVVVLPELPGLMPALPGERERLALLMVGPVEAEGLHQPSPRPADVHDLAGVIAELLDGLHVPGWRVEALPPEADRAPLHPGVAARVVVDGPEGPVELGRYGQVHPLVARAFDLGEAVVLVGELDVDAVVARSQRFFFAPGPPRFPEISLDVALIVDQAVSAAALCGTTRAAGGALLRDVVVFDVYQGKHVPAGKQAVGLRLRLGAERTLEMREAEALRGAVLDALGAAHGAELRV